MILIGDIGASKTLLELGEFRQGAWETRHEGRYVDDEHADFVGMLRRFFDQYSVGSRARSAISAACFGVAGPVAGHAAFIGNRGWSIDALQLAAEFGIPLPTLLNDVAAAAQGLPSLGPKDLITLQAGQPEAEAACAVVSVGTGYNAAYLVRDGADYRVLSGEAGHVPFAPATPQALALRQWLAAQQGEVTIEDLVSGRGFPKLHQYVLSRETGEASQPVAEPADAAAVAKAAEEGDGVAGKTLDLFVELLGRLAGDQALALSPPGGLYIAGGIPPRVINGERRARFMQAFQGNRKLAALTSKIPVHLVLREDLVLLGCRRFAAAPHPARGLA